MRSQALILFLTSAVTAVLANSADAQVIRGNINSDLTVVGSIQKPSEGSLVKSHELEDEDVESAEESDQTAAAAEEDEDAVETVAFQDSAPQTEGSTVPVQPQQPAPQPQPRQPHNPGDKAEDKGDFVLSFEDSEDPKAQKIVTALRNSEEIRKVVHGLTGDLGLPQNLPIIFTDCEDANAYYDSEKKTVTVCYQLVHQAYKQFRKDSEYSKDEAMMSAQHAGIFFLLHEVGHALIDLYDLSILGREEDAADYVAQILSGNLEEGEEIIVDTALQFAAYAEEEDEAGHDFADEHSPSAVRAFNLLCLLYGKDPKRFAGMVGDDALPPARAQNCPGEYQAIMKAGERLLAKWSKA